jgi:cytochrome c551/c552
MKLVYAASIVLGVLSAGSVAATEKLAQSSGAAKYRNDKGAEAKLIQKVKAGGSGVWGPAPMPPNAHVKEEDIKSMVQWILTLK